MSYAKPQILKKKYDDIKSVCFSIAVAPSVDSISCDGFCYDCKFESTEDRATSLQKKQINPES